MAPEQLSNYERDLLARCQREHMSMASLPSYALGDLLNEVAQLRAEAKASAAKCAAFDAIAALSDEWLSDHHSDDTSHGLKVSDIIDAARKGTGV